MSVTMGKQGLKYNGGESLYGTPYTVASSNMDDHKHLRFAQATACFTGNTSGIFIKNSFGISTIGRNSAGNYSLRTNAPMFASAIHIGSAKQTVQTVSPTVYDPCSLAILPIGNLGSIRVLVRDDVGMKDCDDINIAVIPRST